MTCEDLSAALDKLLSESMESVVERERTTFDKLSDSHGEQIVLFGAGALGRRTLKGLRQLGIEPLAFCDNNPSAWGGKVEGLTILSPQSAVTQFAKKATFVLTIWNDRLGHPLNEVKDQLQSLGKVQAVSFLPLFWKYPRQFLPYYGLDLPSLIIRDRRKIKKCFELIKEVESCLYFYSNIRSRLLSELEILPSPLEPGVLFKDKVLKKNEDEVFIDIGAYIGDTIKLLLESSPFEFKKIIALEPDPENFFKLNNYVKSLDKKLCEKVETISAAAGNKNEIVSFDASGTETAKIKSSGSTRVLCGKIDDLLHGKQPSFIKMDIEGAEIEAVEGASRTLTESLPILAISVYHQFWHLWEVALMLYKKNPDYSFFFRPHAAGGWDFILLAVPRHRLAS